MADLTAADLENLHAIIQERFKITAGKNDAGILDAIAQRPNQGHYNNTPFPDIYSKAASIMEAIIRWHPFADGNKRTALLATSIYLDINGYHLIVPLSAVRFTVEIAKNKKTDTKSNAKLMGKITKWIRKHSASKDDPQEIIDVFKKEVRNEYVLLLLIGKTGLFARISKLIVDRWLAIDIYPEYEKETKDIVEFLRALLEFGIKPSDQNSPHTGE